MWLRLPAGSDSSDSGPKLTSSLIHRRPRRCCNTPGPGRNPKEVPTCSRLRRSRSINLPARRRSRSSKPLRSSAWVAPRLMTPPAEESCPRVSSVAGSSFLFRPCLSGWVPGNAGSYTQASPHGQERQGAHALVRRGGRSASARMAGADRSGTAASERAARPKWPEPSSLTTCTQAHTRLQDGRRSPNGSPKAGYR